MAEGMFVWRGNQWGNAVESKWRDRQMGMGDSALSGKTTLQTIATDGKGGSPLPRGPQPACLGAIIGQFKSRVTKRLWKIASLDGIPIWQRNYFERIIRNEREMDRIWRYIESNPLNWAKDNENPKNIQS